MELDEQNDGPNTTIQGWSSLEDMPEEILEIIRLQKSTQFLDTLSLTALKPALTLKLYTRYGLVFADTCARWISQYDDQRNEVIEAFARILPLAPHLSPYLQRYLEYTSTDPLGSQHANIECLRKGKNGALDDFSLQQLQRILLAVFRLLSFDRATYSRTISGSLIQNLFQHEKRPVRYLALRIFCQLRTASEYKLEQLIDEYVGKQDAVMGDYDGELRDFGFLSLFEEKRLQGARTSGRVSNIQDLNLESPSPLAVQYSNVLLPRPNGPPSRPSTLVMTATTAKNMQAFAQSLLSPSPVLLHGLAGSGKTSLVNDFARELNIDSNMVTLHLNEQTDAKMLIGMYTSGSTPGSFTWRAGVLTTAVREGRWIFIEDLDRAPNEVISVILPLIERGELLIPSRGETIRSGPGFKLLASIRTSLSVTGHENRPGLHMLGARLWQRVPVQIPSQDEFREIIDGTHPILHEFLPGIISVYDRVYTLSQKPSFTSKSRTSLGRPISPRDLLKWCRRLDHVLVSAGSKTGREPITEATKYEMFMEAADCFAGSLQTEETRKVVISSIAEEMHIDPQRVEHFLTSHIPRYEDGEKQLSIGRARLRKRTLGRVTKPGQKSRPFANTNHAKRLLEQVGVAVSMAEPVLLVGETGIGKTTVVQQLADSLGFKLTAVNLSQQSEIGDLLGGFKPVNIRSLAIPLKEEFDELFAATGISATKNQRYIEQLGKAVAKSQWSKASRLWREAPKMFERILTELERKELTNGRADTDQPSKRRKTESKLQSLIQLKPRWDRFSQNLDEFDLQTSGGSKGFAFTFVEGNIIKAARNGDWVLLDEINLASPDTLESIADLLHNGSGTSPSILLSETGEIERVRAHPNFRIFGAMNPATDVGKRDLPMGLRSRFTEIYVESPDRSLDDLLGVIQAYLKGTNSRDDTAARDVAALYMDTKRRANEKRLVDGANQVPHFSLRTLTRVLSYVTEIAPYYGLRRSLYEGFAMGFLTLLNKESEQILIPLIHHHLLKSHGNPQALLAQTPRHPEDGRQYVRFMNTQRDRQYWMLQGLEAPQEQPHYIITPFVERNMLNLVRATSTRRFPVLVQGPTSSGKTSMIEYLAKYSGNKFVRINNHEHTDLQEYLGTYVSGSDGQLRFQEGLLVQALRQGHWIVLDELNLAPTDVLEALNRLLDDNRELLIPETQEIVKPHDNFMLFATQNPPGLYGGRKTLSRAFRNRFLELHFDDIPENELDFILEKRSQKVAPSDCRRIVSVYKELSRLRQSNRLFEQKDSFATLRDLFRWALRDADNREQLAENGYMLLAERVRNPEERQAVKSVIETVFKVKIVPRKLYDANSCVEIKAYDTTPNSQGVVWTSAMRRLYILVSHALRNNEPVLLVGETGCGKTTVCQMLADAFGKKLSIVNAHQNTETGDLIGAQRPVRNRAAILEHLRQDLLLLFNSLGQEPSDEDTDKLLATYRALSESELEKVPTDLQRRIKTNQIKAKALFEWSDGSLVQAMKEAQFFLLDEISLADDSVLERLNSVLESHRTILLAEKGVEDSFIQAADGFQFFATMNPGGDYGKRELSPALRNRFTEIWVPSLTEHDDVLQIVETKLNTTFKRFAEPIVRFAEWFGQVYRSSASTSISVRDLLAWIEFINTCVSTDVYFAVLHGASMVYIDTLGANPAALLAINPETVREERIKCLLELGNLLRYDVTAVYSRPVDLINEDQKLAIGGFSISKQAGFSSDPGFAFDAPTTKLNAMRILRALQVQKPILIEGSPGVGKTTLIAALARACGKPLTRINLSEQTDLMDLFGSDVPVEGAEAGHFAWRDAPFLQAMQKGEWVLLDEMNLASQSVLEGLNACLDHRGEVYISELDQTFKRHPNFSVFAAQNPHHQGGGRKGLPASFVNRFTVVYADIFRNNDLELICRHNFPAMSSEEITNIIRFVSQLEQNIIHKRRFGSQGGPWEFNLRDILRWLQLLASSAPFLGAGIPSDFLNLIFRLRFRTEGDRQEVDKIFTQVFSTDVPFRHIFHNMSPEAYQVGLAYLPRDLIIQRLSFPAIDPRHRLPELESVMICVQQNLPCILVGPSGSGKTSIIQHIAAASGKSIVVFPLNADIDTMDLVGGFEQVDPQRAASAFLEELSDFLNVRVTGSLPARIPDEAIEILELLRTKEQASPSYFSKLSLILRTLKQKTSLLEFGNLAETCARLAAAPMTLKNARFEWVDGVLIKALEQGKWLVLDNANLCSASVLDRLNSLLEPNGCLSINEHCGPDGEPKIIQPHPDFRIFLTMDARFGELSRAMRNRAVEIFLQPLPLNANMETNLATCKPESALQRYSMLSNTLQVGLLDAEQIQLILAIALDNLAWSDIPLLQRFARAIQINEDSSLSRELSTLCRQYVQFFELEGNHDFRMSLGGMLDKLAAKTGLVQGFRDAQIIHPLQNSPLVPLLQQISDPAQVYWLAACFELKISIVKALDAQRSQEAGLEIIKPSRMNRLQRSLISGRVSSVAKDSTVRISRFLVSTITSLDAYLQTHVNADGSWQFQKETLSSLLQYWWDTYNLATSITFEEATFQAHLAIGEDLFTRIAENNPIDNEQHPVIEAFQWSLKTNFEAGFKLTTGLSMEVLWKTLRPIVISKHKVMDTMIQMERLATRFDALRWHASISVVELGAIMTSLINAYHLLLTSDVDGLSLLQTLDVELEKLEASIGKGGDDVKPFLAAQFEALRQFQTLQGTVSDERGQKIVSSPDIDTIILSDQSTALEMLLNRSSSTSRPFQVIDYLWGASNGLQPIINTFSGSLLHKLTLVSEVDLKSLRLLESELPIMAEKIAASSGIICQDQLLALNSTFFKLIKCIIAAHGKYDDRFTAVMKSNLSMLKVENINFQTLDKQHIILTNSDLPDHLASVMRNNFDVGIIAVWASESIQEHRIQYTALAWVQLAIGAITLYVPNRAFDPDKRQKLERERHNTMRKTLQNRLTALQQFEQLFTGQDSNLRCQILEEEISNLGEPAEILQEIYRPNISELDQLQGEFSNLLKTVVQSDPYAKLIGYFSSGDQSRLQEIRLIQNNVVQIIKRLTEGFHAYHDLTIPVVNILRCLQIGLSLAALGSEKSSSNREIAVALSRMTPFLGGGPADFDETLISTYPKEFLALVATTSSIETVSSFDPILRQTFLKVFHDCYEQWSKRLESDRVDAESKSGLYRFRGSVEDEEEEDQEQFNELFPAYDDQSLHERNGPSTASNSRDVSVELANIHWSIFFSDANASMSTFSLIRQVSKKLGILHEEEPHFDQQNINRSILPGTLLLLDDQIEELSSPKIIPETYNFYTDSNLPETRKLVTLVHQIQTRFRELQAVDEIGHMQPLEDVLVSCRELLQFRHTEPLAKIITKVEKIHTFIHEWQFGGWASRANSVVTLYDNITGTIVNWRRLELSTWAKLFDMETQKCDDDAKSWWFVAYQVIIAAPLSSSDSVEDLQSYAQKLLKDLETYFSTAIIGQFVQRLHLLKQLHKHLELLVTEVPNMSIIYNALSNFISHYARYEKPVQQNLTNGRVSLEKAMRDILLLASWKDTNIVALRDSAKRSHHKLFKVVRKFRSLLGQPMETVLKQGSPDDNIPDIAVVNNNRPMQFPTVDQSALALCAATVPKWTEKSKRFLNVSKTVGMMVDASQVPDSAIEGSAYLDSFLANIITSTAELQKATPSVLTDENKTVVKHLKTRKRKLFADTLKELRQMGVKYNLGVNSLSKQSSSSIILASTAPLAMPKDLNLHGIEYYLHKSVDFASLAREAAHQHSEDLSSAEVLRSNGFLEGLLQLVLAQRNSLSHYVTSMAKLDQTIEVVKALWAPNAYDIRNARTTSNHEKLVCWLPTILDVAIEFARTHAKLGKLNNDSVLKLLCGWLDTFTGYSRDWNSLSGLPSNIVSTHREDLEKLVSESIAQMVAALREMSIERPDLSFLLDQILPWTKINSSEITVTTPQKTITDLDQKMSRICDTVLVATEKHKKSVMSLPTSTDDPGWLINNDNCLSNTIVSLHCENITEQLVQALDVLRGLDLSDEATSRTAGAVFAVGLPIFRQYFVILEQAITRYAQFHRATCKTSYILSKIYTQIASQGFCTPSEKSDAQDGKTDKLEGGTGLGDGEGAEDISKDIQDDENLEELAQEPETGNREEIEDEKDAVDMADGDMEGEIGEGEERGDDEDGSGDEDSGEDIDEETGDVDDLDPNAVDEKMWDGDGEEAPKEQESDKSKGKESRDEQVAAQENNEAAEGQDIEEAEVDDVGAEQGEEVTQQDEVEKHDPHAEEGEALDLPEDMELDGDGKEGSEASDDGTDDMSELEDNAEGNEVDNTGNDEQEGETMDSQEEPGIEDEMDVVDLDEEDDEAGEQTEEAGEKVENDPEEQESEDQEGLLRDQKDVANADADNAVPSDIQGIGEDQDGNPNDDSNEAASKAQREEGGKGGDSSEQMEAAAEDGEKGRQANGDAPQDSKDETQDSTDAQPFKKLGDALESWHRQQTQIREAPESEEQGQDQNMDINANTSEFQHLQDENAEADAQAMGTATEEQANALDESMAIDPESNEMPDHFQPDEVEEDKIEQDDVMDLEDLPTPIEQSTSDAYEGRVGASINQAKQDRDEDMDDLQSRAPEDLEEDVEEVDRELESTHLSNLETSDFRSPAEARQQWIYYEAQTRDLSLSLTEQLRLILAPTLATKMRGDFRTGKRLNIKRIIPYIASQYKRDKIWMRRSVPSKRSYQIMLAVDDSKSMGESGSGSLAFETLVMVTKSLSMLEVGEICVVGFGEDVKVAHDFDTPFASDAGPKVFQNFGFQQKRTDVTKLVRESIELFRAARAKASGSPNDLWQMELIISDGVCDSSEHEPIRRLLREALEERIMMVFVVVDDVKNKKKGESVMDLKEAKFVKDELTGVSNVKIERYLDTFPFQYYLIVSDVKELPGVLATLLRQWFAEVVDSSI